MGCSCPDIYFCGQLFLVVGCGKLSLHMEILIPDTQGARILTYITLTQPGRQDLRLRNHPNKAPSQSLRSRARRKLGRQFPRNFHSSFVPTRLAKRAILPLRVLDSPRGNSVHPDAGNKGSQPRAY